jgi:hypothetical protein
MFLYHLQTHHACQKFFTFYRSPFLLLGYLFLVSSFILVFIPKPAIQKGYQLKRRCVFQERNFITLPPACWRSKDTPATGSLTLFTSDSGSKRQGVSAFHFSNRDKVCLSPGWLAMATSSIGLEARPLTSENRKLRIEERCCWIMCMLHVNPTSLEYKDLPLTYLLHGAEVSPRS